MLFFVVYIESDSRPLASFVLNLEALVQTEPHWKRMQFDPSAAILRSASGKPHRIASKRADHSLFPLESALTKNTFVTLLESALTKSFDLKSFRIRSYRKRQGEGVNRFSLLHFDRSGKPVRPFLSSSPRWRETVGMWSHTHQQIQRSQEPQ